MRNRHAQFFSAGDLADNGIAFIGDSDQILARAACGFDHLCDSLLGAGDRGPFGFDIAHGAQRFQLIGMGGAVLLVFGNSAVVLRVGLGLGQAIRGGCEHIAIDQGDFEGVLQVVDLGSDALQCSSVVGHSGVAVWRVEELVKIIPSYIRIGPSRASSVGGCFQFICQLAIYRKIQAIGRYILVDQAMIGQLLSKSCLRKIVFSMT